MTTILIVDDDVRVVQMLQRLVRPACQVITVVHATEALACLHVGQQPIDLLLTDYQMPGMTGIELAAAVRTADPTLPMILITAYPLPAVTQAAADLGMTVLSKPFPPALLRETVQRALQDRPG